MTKRILADKKIPPFEVWVVIFNGHAWCADIFKTERDAKIFVVEKSYFLANWDDATAAGYAVRSATIKANVK